MLNVIIIILSSFLFSTPVDQVDAYKVAQNLYIEYSDKNKDTFIVNNIEEISHLNIKLLYIFHLDPVGFILISADSRSLPYFAYSFENNFKINNMPTNMTWTLNNYKNKILYNIDNDIRDFQIEQEWNKYLSTNIEQNRERDVSPLMTAEFDQSAGWNNILTSETGFNGPVGCVAVSMAQIMHYWGFPEQGEGENSYVEDDLGTLYVDFATSFYDFDNMAATYATNPSRLLLYHAGVAVNMDYENSGSGAAVEGVYPSAEYALQTFFKYSDNIYNRNQENYTTTEFRNFIKEELDNSRPVLFSGYENDDYDGGHAWNIDGYSNNNLHCNWGWGGWNNGYFNLTTMGGFPSHQNILINILPEPLTSPIALFEYDINNSTVIFIDLSEIVNEFDITTWDWDYGNGVTESNSYGFNEYTYTNSGEYNVSLVITSIYGQVSEPHIEMITIGSTLAGDVNDDSVLNILDVVMLVNFILGSLDPTSSEYTAADINGDNILNVLDVVTIVNAILD